MANRIMLNQTSYHGAGAIAEIVTEAKAHAFQKAFVCSDPDLIKFGVTGKVTGLLDKEGLAYEVYSDIKANPTIDNVKNGVAAFKASGADYIIAIGGGSSMDTSKAIGIIIANPEFEDVRSLEGVAPTKKPCVPIIAVPTTAGTAAEVTINYVITDVERKQFWWNMIQLLPSSFNQKRTVTMTYENLLNMLEYRRGHKLDEWRMFCDWILTLPYGSLLKEGVGNEQS